ncbi:hypothetical protein DFA_05785 [Cavenderia fasciculata]|uniref:AB hydrolase-1 domain-containing protein n=1 Tax=Cavenderia fasciculata TaxID=261658 RepID=F4PMK4_CACFS|nr:uncharacterized protein DFA_05785 [Cavenderia fasciculata]EGG23651.1 hypothetical protein DFA_05785 [Cavenderia fasciculata]|eukprot:XP_004361502.1 hypothetical protein DFA_05785 [Cavenderia fasciculata]
MSSYWKNFRWIKSSPDEHEFAEKRMMENIKVPYEQKMVKVGDHYINTVKAGSGEPLVLIHGYGAALGFWCANIDFLSKHYTVYAIDLLGFGRSSRPDVKELKTSDQAEEFWINSINEWSDVVGLQKFDLLGHSLGGYLSACFTLKYPQRVNRLVLADSWGIPERPVDYDQHLPTSLKILSKIITPDVPLSILRALGPFGPDIIYKVRGDILQKFENIYPLDPVPPRKQQLVANGTAAATVAIDVDKKQVPPPAAAGAGEGSAAAPVTSTPAVVNRVAEYIYHSNAQSPATGEYLFGLLSLPLGWASNPLYDRIKKLHPDIDVTMLYGSNSWIDREPGYKLKEELSNIKDVVILEKSGHHCYIDAVDQFHTSILNALPKVEKDIRRDLLNQKDQF